MSENKRDLSISMARATVLAIFLAIPLIVIQFSLFVSLYGEKGTEPTWGVMPLIVVIILGIIVHELIHGVTWMIAGRKDLSAIKFGFQWKTITPYAHLKEPIEINAYRMGAFMPGLVLGILVYILSLLLADGNLFWFSLIHTSAAGGDFLILWLIRGVKAGSLVEDHPTNAGCYVLEG
ncbi:MAG: DUF3267 domain-containing protein [Anaerolineae bacterium]|nr:DUF3267 domain-containing protein [Anaerolineae bacterium]